MIFTANLLTAEKHRAFSTNQVADIDITKYNYSQEQHKKPKQSWRKPLTCA